MNKNEIYLNYRRAMQQADRLDEAASNIEKLVSERMTNVTGTLKSAWQSDSSPQYYSKIELVQGNILSDAGKLKKVAQSIRETAEIIRRAELRALEIANKRTYK